MNILTQKRRSVFLRENPKTSIHPSEHYNYKEVAALTGAGAWNIDFIKRTSYIDKRTRALLGVDKKFIPTLSSLVEFYVEGEDREKAIKTFLACKSGIPFEVILKMQNIEKELFWVKAIGKPTYNEAKEIVGIHGVFININKEKEREIALEKSHKIIEHQNNRLRNFAYIVSHNLSSHTNNLQLSLELFNMSDTMNVDDRNELANNISTITANLNKTILHLNELVKVNTTNPNDKKVVNFQEVYDRVRCTLSNTIKDTNADIFVDFAEFPEVSFSPSYLESIFQNLLTNALKYRHADRNPNIQICTYIDENEKGCLLIKDNGVGIDLKTYGDRVFNMYQTFHNHPNATGIGLYMTRNQVEALGGTISVESEPDKYTTFTIRF